MCVCGCIYCIHFRNTRHCIEGRCVQKGSRLSYSFTDLVAGMVVVRFEMVVDEGDGTTLTVQVMSYPPPDHVQWYMNGSLVKPSGLYLISNVSVSDNSTVPITYIASLTISSVNCTTQGIYWASFYGYMGVVNTSTISLPFNCNLSNWYY